ncbi:MAG: hypothetical protein LBV42_03025 [Methanobrevibacter sp.]|jgi:hypothetical protein|nr:hypothetical protein [Methanobrevibacter sp.]
MNKMKKIFFSLFFIFLFSSCIICLNANSIDGQLNNINFNFTFKLGDVIDPTNDSFKYNQTTMEAYFCIYDSISQGCKLFNEDKICSFPLPILTAKNIGNYTGRNVDSLGNNITYDLKVTNELD